MTHTAEFAYTEGEPVKPRYVYVASSWRCEMQAAVVASIRLAGIDCYDFKNPPNNSGFGWEEVMPYDAGGLVYEDDYLRGLKHPRAEEGFREDFSAMERADTCVLVLPCNRSAHLELGWCVGQGKRTAVLLDGPMVTPELMYKMVDLITPSMPELLAWLGVQE